MDNTQHQPIFIVGCPRSGTSLLRNIINSHPNIDCGAETHFLKDLEKIVSSYWKMMERYDFDKAYWNQRISDFFGSFKMEHAQKKGKYRWAEKTPTYAFKLDFIQQLYPNFQLVHIIRDGRDVTLSHFDRWGYKRAVGATKLWRDIVEGVRKFGKTLPENQYFELRYEALVQDSEKTLKALFEYLNEPWDPSVLKEGPYTNALTKQRRQEANESALIYTSRVGAGKGKLNPLLLALFHLRAGSLLRELGY